MKYITILEPFIENLKLKGNELILFALIFGFSQDGKSEFHGSIRYIEKALGISNPTVQKLLKKLMYKKLIQKTKESHYKVYKKLIQGVKESYTVGVEESYTNIYNTNNKDNNTSEDTSRGKLINEFIEELKPLNEIGYTRWFANKTQRKSVEILVKKFTLDQLR